MLGDIWCRWPHLDIIDSIAKEFLGGCSFRGGKALEKEAKARTRRARNIAQYLITTNYICISYLIVFYCVSKSMEPEVSGDRRAKSFDYMVLVFQSLCRTLVFGNITAKSFDCMGFVFKV